MKATHEQKTREERNSAARALLDYGFATYSLYKDGAGQIEKIPVKFSKQTYVLSYSNGINLLVDKAQIGKIEKKYDIPEYITAPMERSGKRRRGILKNND